MKTGNPKPRLTLIAAGGTISHVRDPQTGKSVPGLTAADLLQRTTLAHTYEIRLIDFDERTQTAPAAGRAARYGPLYSTVSGDQ